MLETLLRWAKALKPCPAIIQKKNSKSWSVTSFPSKALNLRALERTTSVTAVVLAENTAAFHTEGAVREIRTWNSSLSAWCTSQAACRQPREKSSAQGKAGNCRKKLRKKPQPTNNETFCAFHPSRSRPCPENVEPSWQEASSASQVSSQVPTSETPGSRWAAAARRGTVPSREHTLWHDFCWSFLTQLTK